MGKDTIYRQDAIKLVHRVIFDFFDICEDDEESPITYKDELLLELNKAITSQIEALPSAHSERLTDDDFETIRIHLNAQKERLCNQQRWEEADEYQRIIDRFMAFASAQPEYEPVKAEDFAKTMSENTLYSFMTWYGEALELKERYGFVICKKTI